MRLLFFFLWVSTLCAKPLQVEVSARSAILMNAETGAILYEKKAYTPAYPGSTTKIATALFALDGKKADVGRSALVSEEALRMKSPHHSLPYHLEPEGTMMWLRRGEVLPLDAFLHGAMMISGNDATNVIAESLSGSVGAFMQEMNQYLKEIGCQSTMYLNPHGLHDPGHVTTAYDLALMMKKGLTIPKFRDLISKVSYSRPKSNKSPKSEIVAFNQLLKPGKYHYPKSIGGKTGYHSQAQATLVAAAEHEGRTLIAVVLGCSKTSRYDDVKLLFETAFQEELLQRRIIGVDHLFSQNIEGAETPLSARLENPLSISYFPAEQPTFRAFIHWNKTSLPIHKGQPVGKIIITDQQDRPLAQASLISQTEVKATWKFRIKKWFCK